MSQPTSPARPTFGIMCEFSGADALGPFVAWADGRDYHVDQIPADAPAGTSFVVGGQGGVVQADGTFYRPCNRCGGTGKTPFTWVFGGDCFDCGGAVGAGTYRTIAEENKLAKARITAFRRKDAKRAAKVAARDERVAAIVANHPEVGEAFVLVDARDAALENGGEFDTGLGRAEGFVSDIRYGFYEPFAWKIEAVVEAVQRVKARADRRVAEAEHFAANPAPLGKGIEVEGTVVSRSVQESVFNGRPVTTFKMLVVTDAGWKVFVTEPRSIDPAEGDRVAFVAELVEGREPDPQFRVGKRPTKARLVQAATPEVG